MSLHLNTVHVCVCVCVSGRYVCVLAYCLEQVHSSTFIRLIFEQWMSSVHNTYICLLIYSFLFNRFLQPLFWTWDLNQWLSKRDASFDLMKRELCTGCVNSVTVYHTVYWFGDGDACIYLLKRKNKSSVNRWRASGEKRCGVISY